MRVDIASTIIINFRLSSLFMTKVRTYMNKPYNVVASNSSYFNGQFRILFRFLFQKVLLSILSTIFIIYVVLFIGSTGE